jgi:hypothetical protein
LTPIGIGTYVAETGTCCSCWRQRSNAGSILWPESTATAFVNFMNVLFLGPPDLPTLEYLNSVEDRVLAQEGPVDPGLIHNERISLLVSHGYRHIISEAALGLLPARAINLHISYLPWNRGAHPNLWSVLEGTPSGVTIHEIDAGIDTGPILVQRKVEPKVDDTFRTSYRRLHRVIVELFKENWPAIREGRIRPRRQHGQGSIHRTADLARVKHLLTHGWDTPVAEIRGRLTVDSPGHEKR